MHRFPAELALRVLLLPALWIALRPAPPARASSPIKVMTASLAPPPVPACPEGMLLVDGDYCSEVEQTCIKARPPPHLGCEEYAAPTVCTGTCEGPERLPYPYGYVRDNKACHIDEIGPYINEKRFYSVDRDAEIERIDRREASGARPGCVSPYGVHDLTGNLDEWTTNETGIPDHGILKGGNWGEWRNACRPMTNGHAAWFRYYQTDFRCCTDPPEPVSGP
jgi:hypothetical protein